MLLYSEQIALEGQGLPCTYLAHHELESVDFDIITITGVAEIVVGHMMFWVPRATVPVFYCCLPAG